MKTTTDLPATRCPACAAPMNAATDLEGERTPAPGDLTVCAKCAELLVYTDTMTLRQCTDDERAEALSEPDNVRLVEYFRADAAARRRRESYIPRNRVRHGRGKS